MVNELLGIQYNIAKANVTDRKVQNLASYINVDSLRAIHKTMDKNKASGIDKVTKEKYEQSLEEKLENLVKRMKTGSYRPNPTRRVYIPKETKGKMRPLGISSYEDKLVESAIAQILEQIYEPKFYNESFGFRPNRNCHQAVREIIEMVQYRKTNYVVEADIRGFFDNVDHEWLMKMLRHDIADKRFLELIEKFLKAGIMENGKYLDSERGTPQGNGASPILANIYLHYVLDNWFDVIVKRQCSGECYLIRYADDFVCGFQNEYEAKVFREKLEERFAKYGLELAEEKTKVLEFGRFARRNRFMPFLLVEILNFQGSIHHIGVGSFSNIEKLYQKLLLIGLFLYPKFNSNKERKRCSFAVMHIFCTFVGKSGWLVMIYSLVCLQFILIHWS